jgi:hypothetical protein
MGFNTVALYLKLKMGAIPRDISRALLVRPDSVRRTVLPRPDTLDEWGPISTGIM